MKKIQDSSATVGFVVAKSYTADAVAAANSDPRIVLYNAIEHDPTKAATEFYYRFPQMSSVQAAFTAFGSKGKFETANTDEIQATYRGQSVKLRDQLVTWSREACAEDVAAFSEELVPEGRYPRPLIQKVRNFDRSEFLFDGREIEQATFCVEYYFEVVKSPLVSHFEVESRGQCYSFAPIQGADGTMQFNVVLPVQNGNGDDSKGQRY